MRLIGLMMMTVMVDGAWVGERTSGWHTDALVDLSLFSSLSLVPSFPPSALASSPLQCSTDLIQPDCLSPLVLLLCGVCLCWCVCVCVSKVVCVCVSVCLCVCVSVCV